MAYGYDPQMGRLQSTMNEQPARKRYNTGLMHNINNFWGNPSQKRQENQPMYMLQKDEQQYQYDPMLRQKKYMFGNGMGRYG